MTKNKKFKIIGKNSNNQVIDLDYYLNQTVIAEKWFKKIKHLKNVPIDPIESELITLNDLKEIYLSFCQFAGIKPFIFKTINQDLLNQLHELYENNHEELSKKQNNAILYKFHHSIHFHELQKLNNTEKINIGWGIKEGPLTEHFCCNEHYDSTIVKNNIYLPWAELGKKPLTYWENKEPNDQTRFNELAKPHNTFRPKFFIATQNTVPSALNVNFLEWFENYKNSWFENYKINKWDHVDQYSAPLLAIADHTEELVNYKFERIEL